jgi:site-specific DNA-methyltransferase (adenine-specific)
MFDSFSLITLSNLVRDTFNVKNIITWDKVNIGMGHYFRRQTEFILFACKGKKPVSRRDMPDIWKIKRIHKAGYPTQKPVALAEWFFDRWGKQSDVVVDLYGGSGSTLIACEKTSRQARLMELDSRYVDVIVKRWQDFTGKIALHAETGQPFAEIAK